MEFRYSLAIWPPIPIPGIRIVFSLGHCLPVVHRFPKSNEARGCAERRNLKDLDSTEEQTTLGCSAHSQKHPCLQKWKLCQCSCSMYMTPESGNRVTLISRS